MIDPDKLTRDRQFTKREFKHMDGEWIDQLNDNFDWLIFGLSIGFLGFMGLAWLWNNLPAIVAIP